MDINKLKVETMDLQLIFADKAAECQELQRKIDENIKKIKQYEAKQDNTTDNRDDNK